MRAVTLRSPADLVAAGLMPAAPALALSVTALAPDPLAHAPNPGFAGLRIHIGLLHTPLAWASLPPPA